MQRSFVRFVIVVGILLLGAWFLREESSQEQRPIQESQPSWEERAEDATSEMWLDGSAPSIPETFQAERLKKNHMGWIVLDASSGEVLDSYQSDHLFAPASVTKLLTGIAALEVLGPEYQFETRLSYFGSIRGGVLNGDLFLEGGGDPFFTASDLMNLVLSLKRLGIRAVHGRLIGVSEGFETAPSIAPEVLLSESYNAGVSLLTLEFNQAELHWGPQGFYRLPPGPQIPIKLGTSAPHAESGLDFDEKHRLFIFPKTKLRRPGKTRLPVHHPALAAVQTFQKMAEHVGLSLPEPEVQKTPPPLGRKVFRTQKSLSVVRLTEMMMEYSNNVFAELLMLGVARKLLSGAVPRNLDHAAQTVERWLKQRFGQAKVELEYVRGSGLTAKNRISPRFLGRALFEIGKKHYSGRTFESVLPISGWKGTLARRLDEPSSAFRVYAKTGTLQYASSIAGYFFDLKGRECVFVLMASDPARMPSLDAAQGEGFEWRVEARKWQDSMLQRWLVGF